MSTSLLKLGQLGRAAALQEEAADNADRYGQTGSGRWFRGGLAETEFALGRWDVALTAADAFLEEVELGSPHSLAPDCYRTRAQIRLGHDELARALADSERGLELARLAKNPHALYPALAACAHVVHESGDHERAAKLADEFLAELRAGRGIGSGVEALHVLAWTLTPLGRGQELIDALPTADVPWVQAASLFAAGDLIGAADVCGAMGAVTEEARDRLWLAATLIGQNRRNEAGVELQRALSFYGSVGATRYLREGEMLLVASAQKRHPRRRDVAG
jgi:hypothetical protein